MSKIQTIPISELVRLNSVEPAADTRGISRETFIIPDYQRGYRWEADKQVKALLNDVLDFQNMSRSTDDRYCLQPIVVTQSSTQHGAWEVIDGQQRLTTLFLVMSALRDETFEITFETRNKSNEFLKLLTSTDDHEDHSNPDFHFMSEAWKYINNWLAAQNKSKPGFKRKYAGTLYDSVHVIWYDPESDNRKNNIDIFNRLNIGKIPLSDSELVKALILSKIKGLFSGTELTLRQAEISNEWYRMETELQKPHKWNFLIGSSTNEYTSHIDLLFDLMPDKEKDEQLSTYLWFEKQVTDAGNNPKAQGEKALELWNRIKHAFGRLNAWFCDTTSNTTPTIYHYIGYLLATGDGRIRDIFKDSEELGKTAFIKYLRGKVRLIIDSIPLIDELSYDNDYTNIKKLLLLVNVLSCEELGKTTDGTYNRFPFDRYNKIERERAGSSGWSLEHISAQQTKDPMKNPKAIIAWLNETAKSLANINTISFKDEKETAHISDEEAEGQEMKSVDVENDANINEDSDKNDETLITEQLAKLKLRINQMRQLSENEIDIDEFNALRAETISLFESDRNSVHELANLVLLSTSDNSSLNNDIFPVKRDRIIELEKNGRFIPPCTRNAFLKFYSPADTQPFYWSANDRRTYFEEIKRIIDQFNNHE